MNAPKLQPFLRQLRSVRTSFLLACAAGWWLPSAAAEPTTPISILNLELSPQKFEALENDKGSNETIDARMTWRGLTNLPVKIRNRGRWSRSWNKSPLKIFLPSNPVENRDCLNLNSTYRDASWIRERLAYHVYQSCGVPASKTRFVEVRHNGKFHGAYVEVEQVDSKFLTQRTLKGAELYKAIGRGAAGDERRLPNAAAYQREYEKQTKDKSDYQSLVQFCSELHSATNTDAFFNTHVDLDRYINYLAAGILIQNWDSLNKNHVLARLPGKDAKCLSSLGMSTEPWAIGPKPPEAVRSITIKCLSSWAFSRPPESPVGTGSKTASGSPRSFANASPNAWKNSWRTSSLPRDCSRSWIRGQPKSDRSPPRTSPNGAAPPTSTSIRASGR